MNNLRQQYIDFIKRHYTTLRGKPVELCSDEQLLAVYYSILERTNKQTVKLTKLKKEEPTVKTIYIYTDGACRNNQASENFGAYAYKLIYGDKLKTFAEVIPNTTNNKMELQAVISALKAIKPACRHYQIELFTDSMYVVKGTNEWGLSWVKNGFKDVKNPDLWKELFNLELQFPNLNIQHIKGHAGHEHQEDVDTLCNKALDNYKTNFENSK
jgi:ribonuclease HI